MPCKRWPLGGTLLLLWVLRVLWMIFARHRETLTSLTLLVLFFVSGFAALVGQRDAEPLDPRVASRHGRDALNTADFDDADFTALILRHYVGNLTASRLFDDYPINTDHRPWIEHLVPQIRIDRPPRPEVACCVSPVAGGIRESRVERAGCSEERDFSPGQAGGIQENRVM